MSFGSVHARSSEGSHGPAEQAQENAMPFAVEVQWRDDLAIVQPSGELDVATVETLRAALNGVEGGGHLLLDLRGLSFIDSTGLHLLVALHQRARNHGFQLTLLAPAAPVDRAIRVCGLDAALPFAAADGADRQRESSLADRGSGVRSVS